MHKKISSLILAISILLISFSSFPVLANSSDYEIIDSGICGDDVRWSYVFYDGRGILSISGNGDMYDYDDYSFICTPWAEYAYYIDEISIQYGVTGIGNKAFIYCESIEEIRVPFSVTHIGSDAFAFCKQLKKVIIPNSVTSIGNGAFGNCEHLESISIPSSITSVSSGLFGGCTRLTNVMLPDSITSIGASAFSECFDLNSIIIPDNVTSIGDYAFYWCENLENIIIPDSVTNIGCGAFMRCTALKSIVIPDSVTYCSNEVFRDCSALKSVIIGKGLSYIPLDMFRYCSDLPYIAIPDGITLISADAFNGCHNLSSITIPKSVIKFGSLSFLNCDSLSDIYYEGSEEDWHNIENIPYGSFSKTTIHFNSYIDLNEQFQRKKSGVFQFYSASGNKNGKNGNSYANYVYSDDYFAASSMNNYNHDLAKMSLRLAMSAFAVHGKGSNKYKNQDANARSLLTNLGFEEIDSIGYNEQPSSNSIGAIAANKKVLYEDNEYTVIAVAIRGGGYEREWVGNFNVGSDDEHLGFSLARDQVIEFLTRYIRQADITGDIKIWITGYSRAAATANLIAAYLVNNKYAFEDNNISHPETIEIKPENIYAYCFETPAGTRLNDKNDSRYNNIYSIVNQNDFVPMLAPENWGYGRYGFTYYLPSPQTNSDYNILVKKMYRYFNEYANSEHASWNSKTIEDFTDYDIYVYELDSFPYIKPVLMPQNSGRPIGDFFQDAVNIFSTVFPTPEQYSQHLEPAIEFIIRELVFNGELSDFFKVYLEELYKQCNCLKNLYKLSKGQKIDIIRSAAKATFNKMEIDISDVVCDGFVEILVLLMENDSLETFIGNFDILATVHYPELCLAWLDSTEPMKYVPGTRKLCINCPVDVYVYDSEGNCIAAIENDIPVKLEDNYMSYYVDKNGQKVIYLPTTDEYQIIINATDRGKVSYSVQEYNPSTNTVKVVNYYDIDVVTYDTLMGVAENLETTEKPSYTLSSDGYEIETREDIGNAPPVNISINSEGNGNISGGGTFYRGEYAQVTATPFDGEEFLGWYIGENLVSTEESYRFRVLYNVSLQAKFTQRTCEINYFSPDGALIAFKRVEKGTNIVFPDVAENPNYMITGVYADAEFTIPVSEDILCNDDSDFYVNILEKDDWIQFDEINNKIIVYSPVEKSGVRLVVASFQGQEQEILTEIKSETVDFVIGKNEFNNFLVNPKSSDTLKIFAMNFPSNLEPLFKNRTINLK